MVLLEVNDKGSQLSGSSILVTFVTRPAKDQLTEKMIARTESPYLSAKELVGR